MRGGILRWLWAPAIGAITTLSVLAYGRPRLGYDAAFSVIWGRQLYELELPDVDVVAGAPTPHPLAIFAAALLAPFGNAVAPATAMLTTVAFGAAGYTAWKLGRQLFGAACGLLFAVLLLTRPGLVAVMLYGAADVWFLALVLFAGVQIVMHPTSVARPLIPLALAGLLRPEGWALSAMFVVLMTLRRAPRQLAIAICLALTAPAIWIGFDWLCAGDPFYSLHATRELASALSRPRGLASAVDVGAGYLSAILTEPVLWTGLAGSAVMTLSAPERVKLPAVVLVLGIAGFGVLALAGLPLIERYVLLPATAIALFAACSVLGWITTEHGWARRAWMAVGCVLLLAGAVVAPAQVRLLGDIRDAAAGQRARQDELQTLATRLSTTPQGCSVHVPTYLDVPVVSLYGDIQPSRISAADQPPTRRFPRGDVRILEHSSRDGDGVILARTRHFVLASRCPPTVGG